MILSEAIQKLKSSFSDDVSDAREFRGEFTVSVQREKIVAVCQFLKSTCGFDMLLDLSGVDNYGQDPRYSVDYLLYSMTEHCHLRLVVTLTEDDLCIDTVEGVWATANWHEREAWDMYGIKFNNHSNLKRILMWEGYPYHPLRKDFPLAGLPADLPDTAVDAGRAETAPMHGGPFSPATGTMHTISREPRHHETSAEFIIKQRSPAKKEQV